MRENLDSQGVMRRGTRLFPGLGSCLLLLAALSSVSGCSLEQCQTNTDCMDRGLAGTICTPKKYCAKVLSDDCPRLLGGEITGSTQIFALMTKLTGQTASLGEYSTLAADLALFELADWSKGVKVPGDKHPSNLRVLACNDGKDDADSVRIARQLVDRLGLPVVMGPVYSGASLSVAREVTIPGGALMLNPVAVTPLLTTLDDQGLVWRTSVSNAPEGAGMWQLVEKIYTAGLKAKLAGGTLEIAMIARPDVYGRGIVEPFTSASRRSTVIDPKSSALNIRSYELAFNKQTGEYSFNVDQIIDGTQSKKLPHVIILAGTAEMADPVLLSIEQKKADGKAAGEELPIYIASEGLRLKKALQVVAENRNTKLLRSRLFVFAPRGNDNLYDQLKHRWQVRYKAQLEELYGVANTYDAIYLLAYSMVTLGEERVTGASLAGGLARLIPGGNPARPKIQAGPLQVVNALNELLAGRGIDYDGVVGPLDFDVRTGDPVGDFDVLCVNQKADFVPSGMILKSGAEPSLVGMYSPCPEGS